jgi:hypothetical protein
VDQSDRFSKLDQTYHLLALCARAEGHPLFYEKLARQVEEFNAWQELPAQAEIHGMAPLLWHHIQQAGLSIPPETERVLQGLYLRQRVLNQAHTQILLEINELFEGAGIQALLLKGLAIAYQYYPDPSLRPVSDIDFLLKGADIVPALDLLADTGFRTDSPPTPSDQILKELTVDSPPCDGTRVHVELHHHDPKGISPIDFSRDNEFEGFDASPHILKIEGSTVYVPGPMDNLRYLSRHLTRHLFSATVSRPLQLKWCADFVSIVEQEAKSIDWSYFQRFNPDILRRLEVFYSLTPMPERIAKSIPIRQVSPPNGLNQYLIGWPQEAFSQWRSAGPLQFLQRTFTSPSDWWLRLYYGIGARSIFWYGQIVYRLQILRRMFRILIRKVTNKGSPEK